MLRMVVENGGWTGIEGMVVKDAFWDWDDEWRCSFTA